MDVPRILAIPTALLAALALLPVTVQSAGAAPVKGPHARGAGAASAGSLLHALDAVHRARASHRPRRHASASCHQAGRNRRGARPAKAARRTSHPAWLHTRCLTGPASHAKRHRRALRLRHRHRHRTHSVLPLQVHRAEAGSSSAAAPSGSQGCPNAYLTPTPVDLESIKAATLCLINEERALHGESPLRLNDDLERAAQAHTQDMVEEDYFEHVAPTGSTPLDRIRASGYIYSDRVGYAVGENIAWGTLQLATPKAIVDSWIASPGHLANILDPSYRETAIGVLATVPGSLGHGQPGAIYTQDFGAIIAS